MEIKLGQFIYTSMTFEKSPVKNPGYRVHYWTKSLLSKNDIAELEGYIAYYKGEVNPIKLQFFALQSNKLIVAKTNITDETDEFKRKIYFAHGYVIDSSEFEAAFRNDPFKILDEFNFFSNFSNMLEIDKSGDLPEVKINYNTNEEKKLVIPNILTKITNLMSVVSFALQSQSLIQQNQRIQIVGDSASIENILRVIISLSPPATRAWCRFDTYYDECNISGLWSVGLQKASSNIPYYIDVTTGDIGSSIQKNIPNIKDVPYGRWLWFSLKKNGVEQTANRVDKACCYIDIIYGKTKYSAKKFNVNYSDDTDLLIDLATIFYKEIDKKFIDMVPFFQLSSMPSISTLEKLFFLVAAKYSPQKISAKDFFSDYLGSSDINQVIPDNMSQNQGIKKKKITLGSIFLQKLKTLLNKKKRS